MQYLSEPIIEKLNQFAGASDLLLLTAACAALVFFYLVGYLLKRLLLRLLVHAKNNASWWDEVLIEAIIPPIRFGARILGIIIAAKLIGFIAFSESINRVLAYSGGVYLLLIGWALMRLIRLAEEQAIASNNQRAASEKRDHTTIAALAKLLRLVLLLILVLLLLQQFGADVSGLVAAGGIGGLAIGFAAKDLLANFFGGILLYMERPFQVGDWIRAPSHGVEGTVEDIGMRMTRLRTFDQRPLYVPNSIFTSIPVENATRMFNRRINISVGVRYDDAGSVKTIVDEVRRKLLDMPDIDKTRSLIVNFNDFAPSSLDFLVYCFTHATDFVEFHGIKEKVLFMIMEVIEKHGASIAYPTSTVRLSKEPDYEPH